MSSLWQWRILIDLLCCALYHLCYRCSGAITTYFGAYNSHSASEYASEDLLKCQYCLPAVSQSLGEETNCAYVSERRNVGYISSAMHVL